MNIRANQIQKNKKRKKYLVYICCSIFFIVVFTTLMSITVAWAVTFSEQKNFYIHGEKVIGTVTGYTRTGITIPHRVELIVEYQGDDGTEYKLFEYADKYKYTKDENVWVIEQEIGKQMPMIIDGKGKCLTASRNVDDYNKSIGWCIAGAVMCGAILIACSTWLGISIKKIIVLNRKNNLI